MTKLSNTQKNFKSAIEKAFKEASGACYMRTALYVTYCQFFNCGTDELKKFIKNELKTLRENTEASAACFRSMLSRELNVASEFVNSARCAVYFTKNAINKDDPANAESIAKLAKFLEDNKINYRNSKKYKETLAKRSQGDKPEDSEAVKNEASEKLKSELEKQAKVLGISVMGLQCLNLFKNLYSLEEKNKVFEMIEKNAKSSLETARKAKEAEAKKKAEDVNNVKPGSLKKAA